MDLEGDRRRATSEKLGSPASIVCKTLLQTVCLESALFNPAGCSSVCHPVRLLFFFKQGSGLVQEAAHVDQAPLLPAPRQS